MWLCSVVLSFLLVLQNFSRNKKRKRNSCLEHTENLQYDLLFQAYFTEYWKPLYDLNKRKSYIERKKERKEEKKKGREGEREDRQTVVL